MAILVEGFSQSNKVPGFYGQTIFGAGRAAYGAATMKVLVVGLKTSAGSMTADVDVKRVSTPEEADGYGGPGAEVSRGTRKALLTRGIEVWMAAPTAAVGAAAATATITVTGTWSTAGTLLLWIAGDLVEVNFSTSITTVTQAAAAIVARINANTQLPVTAANTAGEVTLTHKNPGIRGNQLLLAQDQTLRPSGMSIAIAGGTAIQANQLVPFTGGTGTEPLATLLAALHPLKFDRIAFAQNDATSLADIEAQIDDKAGPLVGRLEHVIVGSTGTLSATTSLAQTTLNDQRFEMKWLLHGETPANEMAASWAAYRASRESPNPNRGYDGHVIPGVRGQRFASSRPSVPNQQSALDNGVSVCTTNDAGEVITIRAITTRSLNGSDPDYKTLDTAQALVPDYYRDRMKFIWNNEFLRDNEWVQDDPGPDDPLPPAGVGHPSLWNSRVSEELERMRQERIITNLADHPPVSEWDDVAKRIMTSSDVEPLPINHQIGFLARQIAA
jgi:phage tail sheath gpL-like